MATILVIDDSGFRRTMIRMALERVGIDVIEAVDGMDGLDEVRRHLPDIIVTDLMMPRLGGVEMIQTLRQEGHDVPVVVATIDISAKTRSTLEAEGVANFVIEPFGATHVVRTVLNLLQPPAERRSA